MGSHRQASPVNTFSSCCLSLKLLEVKMGQCSLVFAAILLLLGDCQCHDKYMGSCPTFKHMDDFEWDKFEGRWYAVEKFDTDSRCLTYDFNQDEVGNREVVQKSVNTDLRRLSINNKVTYRGELSFPTYECAKMIVRFPLSVLGSASYEVIDTDYENYAMLCTCQETTILFDLLTFHRRSCTILQRTPDRNPLYTKKMHNMLNEMIPTKSGAQPDHDFDKVSHYDCEYEDDTKGLQIDVDKILKSTRDEIKGAVKATYDGIKETYETVKDAIKDGDEEPTYLVSASADKPQKPIL